MTFEELDKELPNGFHDAEITSLTIDHQSRCANIHLNLWVGSLDSPNCEQYRKAMLTLRRLYYCSIEAPDFSSAFRAERSYITVAGYPEDPAGFPLFERLKPTLPADTFCCRFFAGWRIHGVCCHVCEYLAYDSLMQQHHCVRILAITAHIP